MSVPKFAVVLLAGTAILLLSARTAFCDEGPAKSAQAAGDKLAWDDGPPGPPHDGDRPPPPNRDRRNARPGDDRQPPGPPRDGDRDRPPPPDRDRRNARPGDDHQPPGPPRDGDRDRPPPRDGQGPYARPGDDHQPPGPPRDGDRDRQPPRDRQGRPGPDRQPPQGPPGGQRMDWQSLERADPEMYKLLKADQELDHQTRELAMQWRQASTEQRTDLKKALQQLVGKQFEVRQQRRALELKRLDTELQRLREAIDRRNAARDKIVDQRVSDLLGVEGDLSF